MTLYSVVLFLHLLGVVLLFAGLGLEWICLGNLRTAATLEVFRSWGRASAAISKANAFSGPLIVFAGAYLATKMKAWPLGWISMSLLAVVVIMGLGIVSGSRMRALVGAALEDNAVLKELLARAHQAILRYSFRIRVALSLGVLYLMGSKSPIGMSAAVMGAAVVVGLIASAKGTQA